MLRTIISVLALSTATLTLSSNSFAHSGSMTFKQAHTKLVQHVLSSGRPCTNITIVQSTVDTITAKVCVSNAEMTINYYVDRPRYKSSSVLTDKTVDGSIDFYQEESEFGLRTYNNDPRSNDKSKQNGSKARTAWAQVVMLLGSHVE